MRTKIDGSKLDEPCSQILGYASEAHRTCSHGGISGTRASASPWELGKLQLEGVGVSWVTWGSQPLPGHKTSMSAPPLRQAGLQAVVANSPGTEGRAGRAPARFLQWHLARREPWPEPLGAVSPGHQVLLVSRARAALTSGTWAWQVGEAGQGAIPAGKPGGEGACRCWDTGHTA